MTRRGRGAAPPGYRPPAPQPVNNGNGNRMMEINTPADPSLNNVGVNYAELEAARLRRMNRQAYGAQVDAPQPQQQYYNSGGGGGGANPADFGPYAEAMRKMILGAPQGQDAGRNPYRGIKNPYTGMKSGLAGMVNPLTAMIQPAMQKDLSAASKAMGQVAGGVSMNDPYKQLQNTRAPKVNPGLGAFAESQGIGSQYGADVGLAQQNANTGAANWSGLAGVLGQNHVAGQRGTVDIANQQGAQIQAAIRAQGTGLRAQAAMGQMGMDREAAKDQQGLDLTRMGFDASLAQQIAAAQMGLNQESRASKKSAQDTKNSWIMELINAGLGYGKAPDMSGLI